MKLNIANPAKGTQKKIDIDDENRLHLFYDRRLAEEVDGDALGDEFKGYVFKITGGNDKDGFPMRQGVLLNKRVKLLLRRGMPCYKAKRKGDRKRKAVRGCIVGPDIVALSLTIVKRGEQELPGLTDTQVPRRLGPKRVGKIVKMFNLKKEDDVRNYVVRRKVKTKNGNRVTKKPKIQRLITPLVLHRRKQLKKKVVKRKKASAEKRKAYFDRLTNKSNEIKDVKKAAENAVKKDSKKTQQKKKSAKKQKK
mmetsp:Transcript_10189/g.15446  ORF Transcript_10189/g.15446 Transcript_10189/m.15446 type:complete len:251 (+) Transcript_10189:125-877(+)|eukprot:CAMPEP_0202691982 /NCGR_PEP_ID=MMETSP1385-20130828/6504_1 /ASSEMBLY_ACC=CAM_ASM_000861 /TAXON_ID=933848 /ORGANISM="Elphidium margaritaceum" /LENGTH=250 /DNA_ID=CAMNT_0049347447 /DNA_START=125 /DNA_END=877 /DNA_ORIENTATION=+